MRGSRLSRIGTCSAIRLGVLKFRGYVINNDKVPYTRGQPLTDADFHPEFEQKGVDMRIGIDMANLSANRSVDLIALATNDTDCIPAMKYARVPTFKSPSSLYPDTNPYQNCSLTPTSAAISLGQCKG